MDTGPGYAAAQQTDCVAAQRCDAALSAAFAVVGKRWSGLILGVLAEGEARFVDLGRALGGSIGDSTLSARLTELTELGLVARTVIEGPPLGVRYSLTAAGEALIPALEELAAWAREHLPAD